MLTIGLPFFNNQDTLLDAIQSIFAQSFDDWNLILIDDGSSDDSLSVAQSVRDPRIQLISDGCNLGLAARLNQITDMARSGYIARMDADDMMHPDRLVRQLQLLEQNRSLDLVDTGLLSIDAEGRPTGRRCCDRFELSGPGILAGRTPVHASVMARTEWFRRNRYATTFLRAQDFELWNRAYANGSLCLERIPEPLYFAREAAAGTPERARATQIAKRRVLRMHGPKTVGRLRTEWELGKSYLKQAAYVWASQLGAERRLVATRNRPLDETDRVHYAQIIAEIRKVSVVRASDSSARNLKRPGKPSDSVLCR